MKKIIAIFLLLGTSIQVFAEVVPSTENKEIKFIKQDREKKEKNGRYIPNKKKRN